MNNIPANNESTSSVAVCKLEEVFVMFNEMFNQEWLRIVVPYFMVMGLEQIIVDQSTASSLMLGGVASDDPSSPH